MTDKDFGDLVFVLIFVGAIVTSVLKGGKDKPRRSTRRSGSDTLLRAAGRGGKRRNKGKVEAQKDTLGSGLANLIQKPDADTLQARADAEERRVEIIKAIRRNAVPKTMRERLHECRDGKSPWVATLTPAEMLAMKSHGIKPVAPVSATCWMHYGWSWTEGHAQGWETALRRLKEEAKACGANAILDVKMRTIPMPVENSMDFTLVGTAVKVDGLPPSEDPIVATVPALEFAKLLDAGIVPTGIAVGAYYEWLNDWRGSTNLAWVGNIESQALSRLLNTVRTSAYQVLRKSAEKQGGGVLAYVNFNQMFEREVENQPKQYLARHIVIATVIDAAATAEQHSWSSGASAGKPHPKLMALNALDFNMVVDMKDGITPLIGTEPHHQSYTLSESEGAI